MCIEANFPAMLVILTRQLREAINLEAKAEVEEILTDIEALAKDGLTWFQKMQEEEIVVTPTWTSFITEKNKQECPEQ